VALKIVDAFFFKRKKKTDNAGYSYSLGLTVKKTFEYEFCTRNLKSSNQNTWYNL